MTEREKDERDLRILKQYEMKVPVRELARRHNTTREHVDRLIEEALGDD